MLPDDFKPKDGQSCLNCFHLQQDIQECCFRILPFNVAPQEYRCPEWKEMSKRAGTDGPVSVPTS